MDGVRIVAAVLDNVRNLGNSGAVANAARACRDRLEASAAVESALRQISPAPSRQSIPA